MASVRPYRRKNGPAGRVLVIGDDTRAFLASVRALHAHGCVVDALPFDHEAPALSSRAIRRVRRMPPPAGRVREWAEELALLLKDGCYDFILPCCERSLIPIMEHRALFRGFTIAFPGEKALKVSLDKAAFHSLARRLGAPVAPGRMLDARRDTAGGLRREFGLPLVMREAASYTPERLDERGRTHILRTPEELSDFMEGLEATRRWHVSAFFPASGAGRGQGMGISVLAENGEVLVAFQHARRLEPENGGGSSVRVSEPLDPVLLEHVRRLSAALELNGIAMFELRRDTESGEAVFIELNARPWGSLPLAVRAGVNFPVLLYELLVHGRRPRQPVYRQGVVMRNLALNVYDLLFRSRMPVSRKLLESLRIGGEMAMKLGSRPGSGPGFDTFDRNDLRPALREIVHLWHLYRRRGALPHATRGAAPEHEPRRRDGDGRPAPRRGH